MQVPKKQGSRSYKNNFNNVLELFLFKTNLNAGNCMTVQIQENHCCHQISHYKDVFKTKNGTYPLVANSSYIINGTIMAGSWPGDPVTYFFSASSSCCLRETISVCRSSTTSSRRRLPPSTSSIWPLMSATVFSSASFSRWRPSIKALSAKQCKGLILLFV